MSELQATLRITAWEAELLADLVFDHKRDLEALVEINTPSRNTDDEDELDNLLPPSVVRNIQAMIPVMDDLVDRLVEAENSVTVYRKDPGE